MNVKFKTTYIYLTIVAIIIAILFITLNEKKGLNLSETEKIFIEENRDTIFLAGYYPTVAEKRFSEKIIKKIEEDTSLKISLYEDTWENNLFLLETGSLPIMMNMNNTKERQSFANFTDTFQPIACGIYSDQDNPIKKYADINGKTIGVEKDVALLSSFVDEYPKLTYEINVYDDFEKTREAFQRGDIVSKNELANLEIIEQTDNYRIHTLVSRLRKNIEELESEKVIIENVYGKGYRLVVMS